MRTIGMVAKKATKIEDKKVLKEIEKLNKMIATLTAENDRLVTANEELTAQIATLTAEKEAENKK